MSEEDKQEVSSGDLLAVRRALKWARWSLPVFAAVIPVLMLWGQSCGVTALKSTIQTESAKVMTKEALTAIRGAVREVVREEMRSLERRVERLEDRQSKPLSP